MYSPNASVGSNSAALSKEKWYPVYGDEISITRYIPKSDRGTGIVFAFRDADELPGADGTYKSRRTSQIIKSRPVFSSADFKSAIAYNPKTERITIDTNVLSSYDYQSELGLWVRDNTGSYIDASAKYNPLGGTFSIRKSAVEGSSFASNEYKLKIPKAPASPRIKVNEKTNRMTGIQNAFQWSADETSGYAAFTGKNGSLIMFKEAGIENFETVQDASGKDFIVVYIKKVATDRVPSSLVQRLLISKAAVESAAE
jgi:hypothetical protein